MVYEVTSRGARPWIAVADPTDQGDISLDILSRRTIAYELQSTRSKKSLEA